MSPPCIHRIVLTKLVGYFVKGCPDFINGRGQVLTAQQQIDALAKAQSIGSWNTFECERKSYIALQFTCPSLSFNVSTYAPSLAAHHALNQIDP